jgi:transposase
MRSSYRPESLPQPQSYRTQSWDHLGLVAGRCEALGIAEVIEQATQHDPERRMVTAGHAVKAMGLNGLGLLTQPLDLVPHFFQHKPSSRLIAPGIHARHRHDDPLGRALDTLDAYGGTALSSLLAATAARRLGLTPPFAHRETTRFPGDGRSNRHEAPDAQVVHLTPGESRAHRPDLNHVRLELLVEHPAGIPGLMQPRSGHSSAASAFGQGIKDHMAQLHTTSGATYLVADSAL